LTCPPDALHDAPIVLRGAEIAVFTHAVEFEQPMLEALGCGELACSDFFGLRVPGFSE
jgi:hypothetical protein